MAWSLCRPQSGEVRWIALSGLALTTTPDNIRLLQTVTRPRLRLGCVPAAEPVVVGLTWRGIAMTGRADVFAALRRELVMLYGPRQVFVFGPRGEPFWTAREPVDEADLTLLDLALRMIEELEASRPRPFSAWDAARGLLVGALDEVHDLYFVVLCGNEVQSAEARVAVARAAFVPYIDALRDEMFTREIA